MRLALAALLAVTAVASATAIVFEDLCPGSTRVERSRADPARIEVFCGVETEPKLVLTQCPKPATVTTEADGDRRIDCGGGASGLPAIVRSRR